MITMLGENIVINEEWSLDGKEITSFSVYTPLTGEYDKGRHPCNITPNEVLTFIPKDLML